MSARRGLFGRKSNANNRSGKSPYKISLRTWLEGRDLMPSARYKQYNSAAKSDHYDGSDSDGRTCTEEELWADEKEEE